MVACALSPAGKIAGCLKGPGSAIAGILKTLEERQTEESEAA